MTLLKQKATTTVQAKTNQFNLNMIFKAF